MRMFGMWKFLRLGFWLLAVVCVAGQAAQPLPAGGKSVAKVRKARPPAVVVPEPELQVLSPEHLVLAQRVVLGKVPCELGAQVSVSAHPTAPGYFVLEHGKQAFRMVPVPTSTGAIRLEDSAGGAVWLQLTNKSMLMDQKLGRRLADACMNADQLVVAEAMARSPAPNLLEPLPPAPVSADARSGDLQAATN